MRKENNISNLLSKKGVCIVSVPIETGFGGFLKNIVRILIGETHENGLLNLWLLADLQEQQQSLK